MHLRFASLSLVAAVAFGCSSSESSGGPAGTGAACADTTQVLALPTPAWQTGATLAAPAGDMAAAMLGEVKPGWTAQLSSIDGWPQHPMIILPLDATATAVDATKVAVYGSIGGAPIADLHVELSATLSDDGKSAVLEPRDPMPIGARDVVLVLHPGAFTGAKALPACGADGQPDPAYGAALASLPEGAAGDLALPFRLATTHEDLPRLYERVAKTPVLKVASVEARTLASFGADAPSSTVAALLSDTVAKGLFELPAYANASGVFEKDADGAPKQAGTTKPGFLVVLPKTGQAPYPYVVFQHGGGQNKTEVFKAAGPVAAAGFAFIAIDLPYHGDLASAGGGSDLDFVNFDDLGKTRDNFRQAVANHQAVFTGIDALNAALAPVLGTATALDGSRGFYQGLSLGGISGSITFATTKKVNAAGLFVAAGGYPEIVAKGLFSLMVANLLNRPTPERQVLLGLAETILDGADPLAYAQRVEDRTVRPRPAVFFQAIGDPVIPEPSSDQWARAFGASLALPKQHAIPGVAEVALPAQDGFAWSAGGEKATRILLENPMNDLASADRHGGLILQDYSQNEVAHCFSTYLATGSCEVIDTGFASH